MKVLSFSTNCASMANSRIDDLLEKNASYALKPISCNICGEQVAGSRYAPHLERCMNGGKRGSRRYFDSLQDTKSLKVSMSKVKKEADPYPESTIVRIKLKDGGE